MKRVKSTLAAPPYLREVALRMRQSVIALRVANTRRTKEIKMSSKSADRN